MIRRNYLRQVVNAHTLKLYRVINKEWLKQMT